MKHRREGLGKWLEMAATPALVGVATILALDVARRVFRHHQLFCPSPDPLLTWNPDDYGIPRDRVSEEWFETPDGEMLYGWYCRAERPIASAVFCHGNTGNLTTNADVIPHLLSSGFNVLLFDYRGFGKSTGHPSFTGITSDGITAARFHDRIRPKHLPSVLYGYSLGGAVAAQVITRHPFDALVLQSTFTNLPDLARFTFPRIPLHLVTGDFFDTLSVLRKLEVPLLLIHGENDETCPSWMAQRLYDACPATKRIEIVREGLHKDLFIRDADGLTWAIHQFVSELPHTARRVSIEQPPPTGIDFFVDAFFRSVRRHLRRHPAQHAL
ncbi:MAG: alpha/beta hydrolase [Acidobacteria bacterium]|nr:alpha/beta hydrolase [Acidobacteriota bacterium]